MINIPTQLLINHNSPFGFSRNLFQELVKKIRRFLGEENYITGNLSILQSPDGSSNQFIHSDNILHNRYNRLLVVSEEAVPTQFIPKQDRYVLIVRSRMLRDNRKWKI